MSAALNVPWYRRIYRWGQTNITEYDPIRYDVDWWRRHWRRTRVQGVIINAGGIVAYYPSRFPLHHRAEFLGDRDLYGELVAAARAEGLVVLARMDSNRAYSPLYNEHPDWFARNAEGQPYREGDLYVACIHGPYYEQFLPAILREIVDRSAPDGVTDNSWSGLDRGRICFCQSCQRGFAAATGMALPRRHDWGDPAYQKWVVWNYARRTAIWDLNNGVTREAGGGHCLWIGMNGSDIVSQASRFRDYQAICKRAEIIMLDSQARSNTRGFQANGEAGKLIHGLLGWNKLIPESTALYQAGQPSFRVASKPEPEVRLWAVEGFAGTIQPWWHHIGAYHEDRRQYRTAEPLFRWHEANQEYLVDREPVATVGVVWSQRCVDFYGRDAPDERLVLPTRGITQALLRARIPFVMVAADHVARDAASLRVLILPNVGALSDEQCRSLRAFVAGGGGLIATGESSRYDEWGDPRPDFGLADLFGAHATGVHHGSSRGTPDSGQQPWSAHSYLRLHPSLRAASDGPRAPDEPPAGTARHPALRGFEETDLLPFGGRLEVVQPAQGTSVLLTYVPPFPIFPPETAWMRHTETSVPALLTREEEAGARVAYIADLDRCFGRDNLPDHADLLANLVRWVAHDDLPLVVHGPGMLDCHLYRQPGRLILHVVNLTNAGTWRGPVEEFIPVGPLRVRIRLTDGIGGQRVRLLVSSATPNVDCTDGWATFVVPSVLDHEVAVVL